MKKRPNNGPPYKPNDDITNHNGPLYHRDWQGTWPFSTAKFLVWLAIILVPVTLGLGIYVTIIAPK